MTTYANHSTTHSLHSVSPTDTLEHHSLKTAYWRLDLAGMVKHWADHLSAAFSASNEPHIWSTTTRTGEPLWHAYDPVNGRSAEFATEEGLRSWLDHRYYA